MLVSVSRCAERDAMASSKTEMSELRLLLNRSSMRFEGRDAYVTF